MGDDVGLIQTARRGFSSLTFPGRRSHRNSEQFGHTSNDHNNADNDHNDNDHNNRGRVEKWKEMGVKLMGSTVMSVDYVDADTRRNKRSFIVGVTTVFLVVVYLVILATMVSRSSILFLKLAENNVGELDLVLTPTFAASADQFYNNDARVGVANYSVVSYTVNATMVSERTSHLRIVEGVAPRWIGYGKTLGLEAPPTSYTYTTTDPNNNSSSINVTVTDSGVMTAVIVFDTLLEKKIGIGAGWNHPPLGFAQCHASSSLLRTLNLKPRRGHGLRLSLNTADLLSQLGFSLDDLITQPPQNNSNTSTTITFNNTTITPEQLEQLRLLLLTLQVVNNNTQPIVDLLLNSSATIINGTSVVVTLPAGFGTDAVSAITDSLLANLTTLSVDLSIIDNVGHPKGKWPAALGNAIVLEKRHLLKTLLAAVDNLISNYEFAIRLLQQLGVDTSSIPPLPITSSSSSSSFSSLDDSINLDDFSLFTIIRYADRTSAFSQDEVGINRRMAHFTNVVADALGGDFPASFSIPLAEAVATTYIFRLFLDQIFNSSLVILIVLGSLLIYSLMLSDVEEKTYEYGMLRALGLRSSSLAQIIVTQSFFFSVPGVALGLLVGFLGYLPLAEFIANYTMSDVFPTLAEGAIAAAVLIGVVVPLAANILPIQRALSHTLRDSLDRYFALFSLSFFFCDRFILFYYYFFFDLLFNKDIIKQHRKYQSQQCVSVITISP